MKSIQWTGTQQELCELFHELIQKGWIPEIMDGERKKISDSITELFDLENTKRSSTSNFKDSFYQQFKGEIIEGTRSFNFLNSKKYERKFDGIKNNNNNT